MNESDRDYQTRNPNHAARMQKLIKRAFSNDCMLQTELAIQHNPRLPLTTIKDLG